MLAAVLFDMDGVLIDTERLNLRFMIEAAKKFGFTIEPLDVMTLRSTVPEECEAYYRNKYGERFDYYAVREERRRILREHIEIEGLAPKSGVVETLRFLKDNGVKTAVVTSSQYDRAVSYMKDLGIDVLFDAIISAFMVERGKPEPDAYLYASKVIGVNPHDCIAVEDSPNGVRSAYSAGCRVAIIPDLTEPDDDMRRMGTWILKTADQLIPIVREQLSG